MQIGAPIATSLGLLALAAFSGARSETPNPEVTASDFGIRCDGMTDDHNTLQSALDLSDEVVVPGEGHICVTTRSLRFRSDQTVRAKKGGAVLRLTTSQSTTLLDMTGSKNVHVIGLTLEGSLSGSTPSSSAEAFIVLRNASGNVLNDLVIRNAPGSIGVGAITVSGVSTNNIITRSTFVNSRGSSVVLTGTDVKQNIIEKSKFFEGSFWGVYLGQGASKNDVLDNYCRNGDGIATIHSAECFAETAKSDYNSFLRNVAMGSGDDGISISGSYAVVAGNKISGSYYSGIHIWGSNNVISGNIITNNGQSGLSPIACIGVNGYFGGAGQANLIENNNCVDDQKVPTQQGIILTQQNYWSWLPNAPVRSGQYTVYGLRIFQAKTTGVTGLNPPVHESGSLSDGGVTWNYINTFVGSPAVTGNIVRMNRIRGFKGKRPFVMPEDGGRNTLIE